MNFEFKSTFKIENITRSIISFVGITFQVITKHAVTLLVINLSALGLLGYLYFQNIFIPAVYGSKPSGEFWISFFQTSGILWSVSTAYALLVILIQVIDRKRRLPGFVKSMKPVVVRIAGSSRLTAALLVLIITMIIRISNYTYFLELSSADKNT